MKRNRKSNTYVTFICDFAAVTCYLLFKAFLSFSFLFFSTGKREGGNCLFLPSNPSASQWFCFRYLLWVLSLLCLRYLLSTLYLCTTLILDDTASVSVCCYCVLCFSFSFLFFSFLFIYLFIYIRLAIYLSSYLSIFVNRISYLPGPFASSCPCLFSFLLLFFPPFHLLSPFSHFPCPFLFPLLTGKMWNG